MVQIGEYTIVPSKTLSGDWECKVYKDRDAKTRTFGKRVRVNGRPTFLASSIEDAKRIVREEFGCETQSSLDDF